MMKTSSPTLHDTIFNETSHPIPLSKTFTSRKLMGKKSDGDDKEEFREGNLVLICQRGSIKRQQLENIIIDIMT